MKDISHGYTSMGIRYAESRKGSPEFARFIMENSGLSEIVRAEPTRLIHIVEFGVGSGQQTEFIEKELKDRGVTNYLISAYDKSYNPYLEGEPDQLTVLINRIEKGEISQRVIPIPFDFDGKQLPIPSGLVDMSYMAFLHHHLSNKAAVFREVARITRPGGRLFVYGAALEDLVEHPLNEFFPMKYEFDARRYPTKEQLKALFENSGFIYQGPYRIKRDDNKPIDRKFLESVDDKTINSVLVMIEKEDPKGFKEGVEKIRAIVEEGERTGQYIIFNIFRTVFWGVKR